MPKRNKRTPTVGEVIRKLADKLDDDTLKQVFSDQEPASIREVLHNIVAGNAERPEKEAATTNKPLPLPGRLTLFTDGASRGNPGQAGAGYCIVDGRGREIDAASRYLGICTNNIAEYEALLFGLQAAGKFGRRIDVRMDSELIVRQLHGSYKVRNEKLKPLFDEVSRALEQFEDYSIRHVPRHENKRADQLANKAIDNILKAED